MLEQMFSQPKPSLLTCVFLVQLRRHLQAHQAIPASSAEEHRVPSCMQIPSICLVRMVARGSQNTP